MPLEPKAQLVDPQGPLDVDGVNATGITTATGGFVGQVQGSATGLAATTYNIQAGIITATKFIGDVTGTASSLAQGANITVGIMTATFVGDLLGNATGLSTTTSNLNLGIVTSTGFRGNFTGLSSGLSGTPNIQTGIVTATKFLGNSSGTVVDLADDTNINVGIFTATKFEGNTTGTVAKLADDTNINVGIFTATKFIGNANGSVTGLADDTNINVATFTATEFKGNTPGTAADLKSGTNLTVGTFTGTKFIGNTPGSATKLADDVNVAASTFTGTKFVGNTPGTVTGIADDTNLNMGTLTGTKFIGNATGSVSAISDDTNLNLGTLTASQFIGNTPGTATGISAAKNLNAGTVTATTFYGDGSGITGAGVTGYIKQDVTAQSGTTTINLNNGNLVYLTHSNNTTIAFSNVPTATRVTIIRTTTDKTISWPAAVKWNGGSAPTLISASDYYNGQQAFGLNTYDGGSTWYGWEVNDGSIKKFDLFAWGSNGSGQIGNNSKTEYDSPIQIPGATWISVSGYRWNHQNIAVKSDGTLWAWGHGVEGVLGQNEVKSYSSPIQIGSGTDWSIEQRAITAGNRTAAAIKNDGTLWAWGDNTYGATGINMSTPSRSGVSSPTQIPGTTWKSISSTYDSMAALKTDGTIWAWGSNSYGKLGQGQPTNYKVSSPVRIGNDNNWAQISGGGNHAAITDDGRLYTWGFNREGQLGHNQQSDSGTFASKFTPQQVGDGEDWKRVSSHREHVAAVKTNGTLWTWGQNQYGMLGLNDTNKRSSPTQIPGTNWSDVSSGAYNCWAIKTDGTMWSWGRNGGGATGVGNNIKYSSPVQIPGNWAYVYGRVYGAYALKNT